MKEMLIEKKDKKKERKKCWLKKIKKERKKC